MSDFSIFDISASGMSVERVRLQVSSINIANANTTRTQNGQTYKPLTVISSTSFADNFIKSVSYYGSVESMPQGVKVDDITERNVQPRLVYEPSHPHANDSGYVAYPNINPVTEMVDLINISRSYEANARAFNATKKMMQSALDIGKKVMSMSIENIQSAGSALSLINNLNPTDKDNNIGFSEWIKKEINQVNNNIATADIKLREYAMGETDNLHQVMMSLEKAKLSFELVVEVRNKLLEGYQEIMRMQV